MHNLYTKIVKILEICKQYSHNIVNEFGNIPCRGPVSKFSDLEVIPLSLIAETESIIPLAKARKRIQNLFSLLTVLLMVI